MSDTVTTASYGICVSAYLIASAVAMTIDTETVKRRHFIAACLLTALWAGLAMVSDAAAIPPFLLSLAEVLRSGGWLYFLLTLWARLDDSRSGAVRHVLVTRAFIPVVMVIILVSLPYYFTGSSVLGSLLALKSLVNVALPVIGLLLIENLLHISGSNGRWAIKHLCLGLGTLMAFDFFIYSDALVQGAMGDAFMTAHGLITALVAPLVMTSFYRLKDWKHQSEVKIIASPMAAFYTMALIASGCYLLTMAAVAYYIRMVGGKWGAPLQISFLVAALLIMLATLASSQIKSHAKIFVLKNFFAYRYDYREEWLRFLQVMSSQQPLSLGDRLVRAMADLMDSPASALWVLQAQDECFFSDAVWNLPAPHPSVRADSALIQFFRRTCRIIDMDEYRRAPESYDRLDLPEWITARPALWLIVPLVHRGEVLGFVVLNEARAPHRLDWEDRDLLNTTAIQAASYLAEELTTEALRSARRLEDFNRQFAFVVHDIKNVVGQMSLMLDNAKVFGSNPEFQKDMLGTVGNSVNRMRAMLEQLAVQRRQPPKPLPLELGSVLRHVAGNWSKTAASLTLALSPAPVGAMVVEATLISVLDLLIDNALSAAGPSGTVVLSLRAESGQAVIEVSDNGPGMAASFVHKELFRPLASSKSSGYGIGAYQTRHLVHEMGARLEVDSIPELGTTMRIVMPLAAYPPAAVCDTPTLKARHG